MTIKNLTWEFLRNTWWIRFFNIAHVGLRVLAIGFATTSIFTMLTSNQEIYMMNDIPIAKARYNYSSALRYKLIVDAIVCVIYLLSSIVVYKKTKASDTGSKTSFYFYLLLVDMVMMSISISGCVAATTVGFVALKGIEEPGIIWSPICHLAGKFCLMVALSITFSYASFICITSLSFISACKLKLQTIH